MDFSFDLLAFFKISVFDLYQLSLKDYVNNRHIQLINFFFQNDSAQSDFNISNLNIKIKKFQKAPLRDIQEVP